MVQTWGCRSGVSHGVKMDIDFLSMVEKKEHSYKLQLHALFGGQSIV